MERIYCKYHRQTPARWSCPSCKTHFCPQCVKTPARGTTERVCPLCKASLYSLGMGNAIPAFWERIPQFFRYPAKFDNLIYIGVLSLASLGFFLPIVGMIVPALIFLATLKYAYGLLEHTALGNLEPPTTGQASHNHSPYKQYVIFLLMFLAVGTAYEFLGEVAAILAFAAVNLAIPSSVMLLAMTGSLLFAINPVNNAKLMAGIGWPYGLLYFFLLLLSGGSEVVTQLLLPLLPLPLLMVLSTFLSAYFIVIMFHMMGYAIYQYHEELGLEGVKEYELKPAKTEAKVDELLAEINILISEGRIDDAKARLKQELRHSANPEHFQRYHKLLLLGEDEDELARNGKEYINLLMVKGQKSNALAVAAQCLEQVPEFAIDNGEHAVEIAETAYRQGRLQDVALKLLNDFGQHYPRSRKLVPAAGLLEAKLLCEYQFDDQQAKTLLENLLRDHPEHELVEEIRQYLQLTERLQSVGNGRLLSR
ncbi:MAG: hypothetical protein PHE55_08400 [Methylococcaceae bacterium]|nr:hypothetical protein [Methylococcaceae bacterium]